MVVSMSNPVATQITVNSVKPSTTIDTAGAVDATVTLEIADRTIEFDATLMPERGRPTVNRRHPLGTDGSPLDVCFSDPLCRLVRELEEEPSTDGPEFDVWLEFDRGELISEICQEVNDAAILAGL
jgi:hypothetical protein